MNAPTTLRIRSPQKELVKMKKAESRSFVGMVMEGSILGLENGLFVDGERFLNSTPFPVKEVSI